MSEKLYKVVVEACDGTHVLHKALTYDDAKEKAEEWLGRKFEQHELRDTDKSTTAASTVSDYGSSLSIERYLSDVADLVWDAVSYSWKVTFETLDELKKEDEILQSYLEGLTDEQIKQGLKELKEAGFISPEKAEET